jgi:hypothetical protein
MICSCQCGNHLYIYSFQPFIYIIFKNVHFTKTGSGQTQEELRNKALHFLHQEKMGPRIPATGVWHVPLAAHGWGVFTVKLSEEDSQQ